MAENMKKGIGKMASVIPIITTIKGATIVMEVVTDEYFFPKKYMRQFGKPMRYGKKKRKKRKR